MKKLFLLMLPVMLVVFNCSGGGNTTGTNNTDDSPNLEDDNNGNNIVYATSYTVESDGVEIGTLIGANSLWYTFVSEEGYTATINRASGELADYVFPYLTDDDAFYYYESVDCSGIAYHDSNPSGYFANDTTLSTRHVWRDSTDSNKMLHVTSDVPVQISMNSKFNLKIGGACSAQVNSIWSQPIAEITEVTSGIKVAYNTPITLVSHE